MGPDGKLPERASFSEGSLIVKEFYENNELALYVVMKKDSKSNFASNAWVWVGHKPNGDVGYNCL